MAFLSDDGVQISTAGAYRLLRYARSVALSGKPQQSGIKLFLAAMLIGVFIFALASPASLAQPAPETFGPIRVPQIGQTRTLPDSTERSPWTPLPGRQSNPSSLGEWQSSPIFGGEMTSIAIDPINPQIVYVGTRDAGVFKTTNGGVTWRPARQGLSLYPVRSLKVDPQQPQILYVGTDFDGVWKSTDGGDSWFQTSAGLDIIWWCSRSSLTR